MQSGNGWCGSVLARIRLGLLALPLLCLPLAAAAGTVLRTASQDSAPKFLIDYPYDLGGIAIEVMRAIERVDPELKFTGYSERRPFARIVSELETGQLDVFVGLARTESRDAKLVFLLPPIYAIAESFFARSNDPVRVADIRDIIHTAGGVAVWEGTAQQEYARRAGLPLAGETKSIEQGLQMLLSGRARFFYGSEMSTTAQAMRMGVDERIRVALAHFQNGRYIAVPRSLDPSIQHRLSAALRVLESRGELARIFQKYCRLTIPRAHCERAR